MPIQCINDRTDSANYGTRTEGAGGGSTERYPTSIIDVPVVNNDRGARTHPTEKPVQLGRYLIRTYTDPGDLVLDNACGTGAFLVAAKAEGRRYLGMERSPAYAEVARERLRASSTTTAGALSE